MASKNKIGSQSVIQQKFGHFFKQEPKEVTSHALTSNMEEEEMDLFKINEKPKFFLKSDFGESSDSK